LEPQGATITGTHSPEVGFVVFMSISTLIDGWAGFTQVPEAIA
jgi:hypothetical protein